MMTILFVLLGLAVLLAILSMVAPKNYRVSREIKIDRPLSEVFDYLRSLKKMDEWSPWAKKDPNMKKTFTGTDGEVGAISAWIGNKDVGEGEQEIKAMVEGKRIDSELRFLKPWKSTSDAFLEFEELSSAQTKVTWGFSGKNNFPMNIIAMFMSMDKMIGKDFEEGLSNIKSILEN